ncbi:MAG: hypothetical protein AAF298_15630 [Cyanobacteria bacterium P01_A01_bin.40]
MSKTITMSFFPAEGNRVKAFALMIRRLLTNAEVCKIRRHEQRWRYESPQLDFDTLMSILETPESESFADSEDSFSVVLQYKLASGELVPLDLDFHGIGYQMGHTVRNDSCIELSAQDSGLWRSLKQISRDIVWTGLDVPEHIKSAAAEKANLDTELLFLHACGFIHNQAPESYSWEIEEETYIDHAAVYYESGWSSPLLCQMVYHKDPYEFAKDFERIYADYHWGITMPLLYSLKKDIWQLSKSEIASLNEYKGFARRCGKEYQGDYKYFSRQRELAPELAELDSVNFVESLDQSKIQQLVKLPVSHVKEVFSAIAESELPEVRFRDFDEQGMVLLSGAYMSIWRAYLYLVELSSDYLE